MRIEKESIVFRQRSFIQTWILKRTVAQRLTNAMYAIKVSAYAAIFLSTLRRTLDQHIETRPRLMETQNLNIHGNRKKNMCSLKLCTLFHLPMKSDGVKFIVINMLLLYIVILQL